MSMYTAPRALTLCARSMWRTASSSPTALVTAAADPQFEMVEIARRCHDLEGCPKADHTTVGRFMQELEANAKNPDTYSGELYLELHRGTLTNQHNIKRHNRLSEIALHNLEALTVCDAVESHIPASDAAYRDLQCTLLVNSSTIFCPAPASPVLTRNLWSKRRSDGKSRCAYPAGRCCCKRGQQGDG